MDSVTICNLALMMLGMPTIASFTENNNNAKLCKELYPILRDRVLRDHAWSFATDSFPLQIIDEGSVDPEYSFSCALPADCIRVLYVSNNIPYRRVGNRILVNEFPATVIYTKRVEDPNLFDVTFVEALQFLIASTLGMANTRDASLIQYYNNQYQIKLAIARSIDSGENRFANQVNPKRSRWCQAHFASGPCMERHFYNTSWTEGTEGKQEV